MITVGSDKDLVVLRVVDDGQATTIEMSADVALNVADLLAVAAEHAERYAAKESQDVNQ